MTETKLLIVEDDRIVARGIEKRLRGLGYALAGSAASAEEAIRMAEEHRPAAILMDIDLGRGMDGIEAAGMIRARFSIPVIYLTALSDEATLERAKLTEPFGYVLKPFEDKDLQSAIEIALYKHKMEERMRENERWLAATLGSIGDGVIATDEAGRVRFMNSLAEQLTGWTIAEAIDRDLREIFQIVQEKTREPVPNPVFQALEKREPVGLAPDTVLIDKSGTERPIDDSAAPIQDPSGRIVGAVLIFRDTTERRRLEEHLRESQKMEAIGRLAGGIAHDFNNIMTAINGYSELLLAECKDSPKSAEFARNVHDAGQRAASLTQQIMAYSRKQMLVPCVLNLNTVVRDMESMVQRLIGSDIELRTETDPNLGQVKADPTQIGQVILNLAANARDAMPNGGQLLIATSNVELDEAAMRLGDDITPGPHAMLCISDTGAGMSPEVQAKVFEPFFTTKGRANGTGLGLASVQGIVRQSGGRIEVTSDTGRGHDLSHPPAPGRGGAFPAGSGRSAGLLGRRNDPPRRG